MIRIGHPPRVHRQPRPKGWIEGAAAACQGILFAALVLTWLA